MQNISVISLKNILSLSVGCLFILLLVSFAVQKLLSLIMPYFFIFAFISFGFGEDLPPKLLQFKSRSVLLMLPSRNFL